VTTKAPISPTCAAGTTSEAIMASFMALWAFDREQA
jgi:hypothetical protein